MGLIKKIEFGGGGNGSNMPRQKRFLSEVKQGVVPQTLWHYEDVGHTQDAKRELLSLLAFKNSEDVFVTPKPSSLIKRILQIATDQDSIVLDSFAGSGTTAHAVLALNAEDSGRRRFILVEQENYADKMTAERVRRVIKGVKTSKDVHLKKGLGGSFSYFTLGQNMDEETLLQGGLPSYLDMARYVFFTTTGEKLDDSQVREKNQYLGQSSGYEVYMIYQPDIAYLKSTPLNLRFAMELPAWKTGMKKRLVIGPMKYLDEDRLDEYGIEFCQLPWGVYKYRAD